ncbi:MAG: cystathionine gamma-synthase family protein [Pseudomonadales bacterium]|jgi:O-acetylhomoserine (thiol)-lyase|nr:cystathionine gamma-synthase family protein [Pseudomonadales bacterium]
MSKSETGFTTRILHGDRQFGVEHGSLHKPIHTSVAYGYEDARELAAVFQGRQAGYSYGRQSNPTVEALQEKITAMEGGVGSVAFATGMGAIGSMLLALMKEGDHMVSSAFLFGNTNSLFTTYGGLGLAVDFVDATDVAQVEAALRDETRLVFVETIANPRTQIADLEGIGDLCRERGLLFVVDNTMTSPWLFRPRDVGAGLVVNALTKYVAGHGAALGGSVTDTGLYDWTRFPNIFENYKSQPVAKWGLQQIRKKGLRDLGATLGPEAAHHIALGAETLALRLDRQCSNARALAHLLASHPRVGRVHHPSLADHPEHARAARLFRDFGALLSFELDPALDPFEFMNALEVVVSSSNLGDNRTLAIPVAHTIFHEMGAERRASMGVADSLIRVSVGIEDPADLIGDFEAALARFD